MAASSHESTTPTESVINHFGILKDTINVVRDYHDENKLFVGHFIMNQSSKNFGGTIDSKTLKQYRYVILGHGHNHEMSRDNWCQLGSIRYVDFGEDPNIRKVVGVCLDYESDRPKWLWIPINSCYPMENLILQQDTNLGGSKDTSSPKSLISQAQSASNPRQFKALSDLLAYLDQLNPKTKVRVIFQDYSNYREFLPYYQKYKDKFILFKDKKDFLISVNTKILQSAETNSLQDSLIRWMEQNKIPAEIQEILKKELE